MAENEQFDIIILGGGPSGSSAAIFLSKAGKKVLLLDRAHFPREKICGDGISGRSVRILSELGLINEFRNVEHHDMYGVTFSSPKGVIVPISSTKPKTNSPPGFVCRREIFDNILFQAAKKACTRTIEGFFAKDLVFENGFVVGVVGQFEGKEIIFRAKVIVGADGAAGISARKVGAYNDSELHQCSGIRAYYDNVDGMGDQIELHFIDDVLPGYFWVFPLPNKRANVGIGMMVSDMKKKRANLQKIMFDIINNHPVFKERFKNAKRITDVKSWLLPFGSRRMKNYGNGYVLVGDAASLIDPFTGEGIGNALTSGKYAAETIIKAFETGNFSEKTFSKYPELLFADIGDELKTDYELQKLANNRMLFNLIIDRAKKSKYVQAKMSEAILNAGEHKTLKDPLFFIKALIL